MKIFNSTLDYLGISLVIAVSMGILGACGGGNSEQFPKALSYASLDGAPGKVSLVDCATVRALAFGTSTSVHPCGGETVFIYKAFRSNEELEPFKAELALVARAMFAPIPTDTVRALVDPNYFAQHDLLLVDTFFSRGWKVDIQSIYETPNRVEVCFKRVKVPSDEIGLLNFSSWFSIPKTDKPIVLLPFADWTEFTPLPVGFRCSGGAA